MKNHGRILVVEDDRAISELVKHILSGHGFKAESAFNGIEALEKVEDFRPNLIIMDVNMPQMDGWQTLAAVKSSPKTSSVPVIMCTEKNSFSDIEKANDLGCQGYITKPITHERLLKKISEVMEK